MVSVVLTLGDGSGSRLRSVQWISTDTSELSRWMIHAQQGLYGLSIPVEAREFLSSDSPYPLQTEADLDGSVFGIF